MVSPIKKSDINETGSFQDAKNVFMSCVGKLNSSIPKYEAAINACPKDDSVSSKCKKAVEKHLEELRSIYSIIEQKINAKKFKLTEIDKLEFKALSNIKGWRSSEYRLTLLKTLPGADQSSPGVPSVKDGLFNEKGELYIEIIEDAKAFFEEIQNKLVISISDLYENPVKEIAEGLEEAKDNLKKFEAKLKDIECIKHKFTIIEREHHILLHYKLNVVRDTWEMMLLNKANKGQRPAQPQLTDSEQSKLNLTQSTVSDSLTKASNTEGTSSGKEKIEDPKSKLDRSFKEKHELKRDSDFEDDEIAANFSGNLDMLELVEPDRFIEE